MARKRPHSLVVVVVRALALFGGVERRSIGTGMGDTLMDLGPLLKEANAVAEGAGGDARPSRRPESVRIATALAGSHPSVRVDPNGHASVSDWPIYPSGPV
eukprot:7721173-Pyramimonas_sp.AAC.1